MEKQLHCNTCDQEKPISSFCKNSKTFCKQCANAYAKNYREKNHEEILKKQKDWYSLYGKDWKKAYEQRNKEEIRATEYNRYHSDNNYRMKKVLRTRLYKTMKGEKTSTSMLEYLDVSIDEFRKWIEYQFSTGINWDNYGTQWEIDHVYPCSRFDLSIEADRQVCFNWKNMRPLLKKANSLKTNKILDDEILKHDKIIQQYLTLNPSTKL